MKKKIIFCFDIDNTICKTKGKSYRSAKPYKSVIKLINKLFDKGHFIKIFTARYMGRNNDNIKAARKEGYTMTLEQLKSWDLKFHKLIFGKPSFDILIDDKSIGYKKNLVKKLNKYV